MIAGEIGEYRHIDSRTVHAPFLDADGTGLQCAGRCLAGAELRQITHQGRRFRRGKARFRQGLGEAGTQRADDGAGLGIGTGQALADRRLAIGAGDGDQRQRFARVAVDGMRERTGQRAQRRDREIRPIMRPCEVVARLPQHGHGAARQRIADVTPAIGQGARIGQEEIACLHLAAVVGHAARYDAHAGQAFEDGVRRAHSLPFPASASAT